MTKTARAYLWDATVAAQEIMEFSAGKDFADYSLDLVLRAAIERKFEILGEAFGNIRRMDITLAARIPDAPRSIGLRNVLIHRYAEVDHRTVWSTVVEHLPKLLADLEALLAEEDVPPSA